MADANEHHGKLASDDWRDRERLLQRFEEAHRRGEAPRLGDFLLPAGELRRAVLIELVHTDLELRMEAGEVVRVESYFANYPELTDGTIALDLVVAEYSLRRRLRGERETEEYRRRFPHMGEELERRLAQLPEDVPTVRAPPLGESAAVGPFPAAGERVGDYELLRELGRGAFGCVFLARQSSLGRLVALKVCRNISHEARTQATLEHENIVLVFGETIDAGRGLRLLAMRYVQGAALESVLLTLSGQGLSSRDGPALLRAIAAETEAEDAPSGPSPLHDLDAVEAVCWIGARLAEALAFAHARGVLHRDVKPANVLLDRLGRPLLADFNLAFDPRRDDDSGQVFGGTPMYMAPEHLDAWEGRGPREAVDRRADVYALGLVVFEMLTGARPAPAERKTAAPSPRALEPEVPAVLDRAVRRALDPDPGRRYQSAQEFAAALEGCREWQRAARNLPPAGRLTAAAMRQPRLGSVLLPLLPHAVGAGVDLAYNYLWLAAHPDGGRWWPSFLWLALVYSAAALLVTALVAWGMTAPLWRARRRLEVGETMSDEEVTAARRRALRIPGWSLGLSAAGWLPGVVVVPLTLTALAGPAAAVVYVHLGLSFALAGLIALTYNAYAALFMVLRVGYPGLWGETAGMGRIARAELDVLARRLGLLRLLAWLVPLTAVAALLLSQTGARPEAVGPGYGVFQGLLLGLIALGMLGSGYAARLDAYLRRTIAALTGGDRKIGAGA